MNEKFYIGGKHAVLCALNNPNRKVHEVYLIKKDIDYKFSNIKIIESNFFRKIFHNLNLNHQNVAALVSPLKNLTLKEEIKKNKITKLIALNGVSDQRNIGSIMRTVLAFNFDGIILENKFFNQKNPLMIKAASGAIEYLKFFAVSNIKNEIKTLKKENFSIIGFDADAKKELDTSTLHDKIVFIYGSEQKGMQNSVIRNCDHILKLGINKKINSLNVSNAVAASLAIANLKKSNK